MNTQKILLPSLVLGTLLLAGCGSGGSSSSSGGGKAPTHDYVVIGSLTSVCYNQVCDIEKLGWKAAKGVNGQTVSYQVYANGKANGLPSGTFKITDNGLSSGIIDTGSALTELPQAVKYTITMTTKNADGSVVGSDTETLLTPPSQPN